jgi:predicted nucleotidyltransferase
MDAGLTIGSEQRLTFFTAISGKIILTAHLPQLPGLNVLTLLTWLEKKGKIAKNQAEIFQ